MWHCDYELNTKGTWLPAEVVDPAIQTLDDGKYKCETSMEDVSNNTRRAVCGQEVSIPTGVKREALVSTNSISDGPECLPPPAKRTVQSQMPTYPVHTDPAMTTILDWACQLLAI